MFVEYTTKVDSGLAQVENELDEVRASLQSWADVAYREGEQLRSRVGPSERLARDVDLEIGIPEIHSSGVVYPVHWTASGANLLFPELQADLVLTKQGSRKTSLTLRGTYRPPLGVLGRLADRAGLHLVAEATVKNWMDRLAEALSSPAES
jgi:hypothetical protein